MAKVGVVPATDALRVAEKGFDVTDEDGLEAATREFFRTHEARYDCQVQLAVGEKTTPAEDPTVDWPEDVARYRTVTAWAG
ncbi:hypothetical protein [Gemmata sp.]|uniref:hypothetical protein n=1 Tax=Gemmata sp. TaxID=1914242 RepID=UPI003F72D097